MINLLPICKKISMKPIEGNSFQIKFELTNGFNSDILITREMIEDSLVNVSEVVERLIISRLVHELQHDAEYYRNTCNMKEVDRLYYLSYLQEKEDRRMEKINAN